MAGPPTASQTPRRCPGSGLCQGRWAHHDPSVDAAHLPISLTVIERAMRAKCLPVPEHRHSIPTIPN